MVGRAFAVPHQDEQHYTDWPDPQKRMLGIFALYMQRCSPCEDNWDGTVGVFPTFRNLPGHVGIFSSQHGVRHIVHARADARAVLEQRFDPHVRETLLVARFAFPGLKD